MSKKDNQPQLSKTEQQRRDRSERLERLKDKDGGKKKLRTDSRFGRILFPVVIVGIVAALVVFGLFQFGVIQRNIKPMHVGDEPVSMAEYRYHYNMVYNTYAQYAQYGIVATDALGNIDLKAPSSMPGAEDQTMGEFMHEQAQEMVQRNLVLAKLAEEEGYSLSEEDVSAIDGYFGNIELTYPEAINRQAFYDQTFGQGTNEITLRPIVERAMLANRFAQDYPETFEISDAEVESLYQTNSADYDVVDYRVQIIRAELPTDHEPSDVETEEAVEAAKAEAAEMMEQVTDEETFAAAALVHVPAEEKGDYKLRDGSLQQAVLKADAGPVEVQDWLFDEERETGDTAVIATDSDKVQYVLYFLDRYAEKYPTVRHILIPVADGATDEEIDAVHEEVVEVMNRIGSYEEMVSVGDELLADGSAAETAEYEVERQQMVEPFEDWAFDPDRTEGEMGVVDTSYGSHVMYFVGHSDDYTWQRQIDRQLRQEEFGYRTDDWLAEDRFAISVKESALHYAEPSLS